MPRTSKKNYAVFFRTSKEIKEALSGSKYKEAIWKRRTMPDPLNPNREICFSSLSEYLEYCVACLNQMSDKSWDYFKHMFNPYFPNK